MRARILAGIVAVLALAAWFGWRGARPAPVATASEPAALATVEAPRAEVELAAPATDVERTRDATAVRVERTREATAVPEARVDAPSDLQPADARLLIAVVATEDGRALPGIRVSLRPEPRGPQKLRHLKSSIGDESHAPLCDAEGKATLHVRAGVAFTLTAERIEEPRSKTELPIEALAQDEQRAVRVELATATDVVLYGRTLDADTRSPISGARVTAGFDRRAERDGAEPPPICLSSPTGLFGWPAHKQMDATLRVEAADYAPRIARLDPRHAEPERAFEIELSRAARLVVRVHGEVPASEPLHVRVTASLSDLFVSQPSEDGNTFASIGGLEQWDVEVDADGRALLEGLPPRVALAVAVRAGSKELARHTKPLALAPGEQRELEIAIGPGATIVGTLRDQTGAPVADGQVSLNPVDAQSGRPQANRKTTTDAAGAFEFADVSLGSWWVGATPSKGRDANDPATGLYGRSGELTITASDRRVVADLVVARGVAIAGLVVDAAGRTVGGMRVLALDAELTSTWSEDCLRQTVSREDGTFVLPRVSVGEWKVWADAGLGFTASEQMLAKGGDTGVRLVVVRGLTVVVTVLDEAGVQVSNGTLTISESVAAPGSILVNGFGNGECTFDGLRPGRWEFTALTPAGLIGSARLELVASTAPQQLTLTVAPGGTLELSILEGQTAFGVRHGDVRVAFDSLLPGAAAHVVVPAGVSTVEWTSPRTGETQSKLIRVAPGEKVTLRLDEE